MGNCYSSGSVEYTQDISPRSSVSRTSSKKRGSTESFKTERRYSQAHPSIWLSDSTNLHEDVQRIQLQHSLLRDAWNGDHFIAPVKDKLQSGIRVLDIGSGMGVWVCETAAEYPKSKFTAIDVLTEVTAKPLPHNARFTQNTLQKKLRLDDKTFDYVYVHFLTGYFTKKAWEDLVFKEVVRVTDSGGWIEFVETSLMLERAGPTTRKLLDATFAWANSKGLDMSLYSQLSRLLGCHPQIKEYKRDTRSLPIGSWGGLSGELALKAYLPLFRIMKRQNMEFMSASIDEYDTMLDKLPEEFDKYRTTFTTYRYIAQKA